jgi:hypothetical protein
MELDYLHKQGRLQTISNDWVQQSNPFFWKDKMSSEMEIVTSNYGSQWKNYDYQMHSSILESNASVEKGKKKRIILK